MLKLYDYSRSSACFRVRIALNIKKQPYEIVTVHLLKEGGEQFKADYRAINPQGLVPTLQVSSTHSLTQSLAIIEYLEETFPRPALLSTDPIMRAQNRAFAQIIACDIHPLNNLRVLKYLADPFEKSEEQRKTWYLHWLELGFKSLEAMLSAHSYQGRFCFGDTPTLADIFLVPQVYNALRYQYPMVQHPLLHEIYQHCLTQTAFNKALPS
jgi:maleylacetoacetate isomerase